MAADTDGGKEERFSVGQKSGYLRFLGSVCALVVAGIGLVALLGWCLDLPLLASLGSGMIPVAPSTAVLFMLYAGAIFLRMHLPESRVSNLTGLFINTSGAAVVVLLFVLSLLGIHPEAEHLGFHIVNIPGELQIGHMSPVTAFCFLLSSLSFIMSLPVLRTRRQTAIIAWWIACCQIAIASTLVLAYLYGAPILYKGAFIPPAALTSLAFIGLGTALLFLAEPHAWPTYLDVESASRASRMLLLFFVFLAAGIVVSGFMYYRNYEKRHREEVVRQLAAIGGLKVDGIVNWRKERLGDAAFFYENVNFSKRVQLYLQKPKDAGNEQSLRTWLKHVRDGYHYDQVFLLDSRGGELMSVPETRRPVSRHISLIAAEVLRSKQIAFADFYRNEHDGRVYLAVLTPILEEHVKSRAIGTLVLSIDPEEYFYPFLIRWPSPSESAETLLVRREGNEAVFLNELRFRKNSALNLRRPLDQKELPAAQAALGRQGIMEGRDYRGVPVIADLRAVPGSPWFLVSRIDVSEVVGPVREKFWMTVVLIMALLTSTGGGVGLVWKRQRTQFYREKYEASEALRVSEERLRKLNEELEQRVRERTAQLETVNKELEGFSYSVSHDLRAPLRHITGFAELLIKRTPEGLDEKSRHYLDVISESARQMGRLVDDLLSFSRMGRAEMLQTRTNLDKIVEEAVGELKTETRGRDIEWKIGHLPEVYGDPVMLKMVVENLLSNAIKFTRLIPRAIIEVGRVPDAQDEEIFYVRDNGAGFDMKYVDKLFGLFQRLHRPEEFEGTGLGLANVRRIITRHGGRTWAEGALNKGASVYFSLPKIKET